MKCKFLGLLTFLIVAAGCGGSGATGPHQDSNSTRPSSGNYRGDSIYKGETAPIQSAEVQQDGSAVIVVGPYNNDGGPTITIVGTFTDDGRFVGTTERTGEASKSTSGTHESSGFRFILQVPLQGEGSTMLTIDGMRTQGG